jgi:hypothetical protein
LEESYDSDARLAKLYYISSEVAIVVSVSDVSKEQLQRIMDEREPAIRRAQGIVSNDLLLSIIEQALDEEPATRVRIH